LVIYAFEYLTFVFLSNYFFSLFHIATVIAEASKQCSLVLFPRMVYVGIT